MSDYSANITVTVPIAQRETGKRISRALDADTGGYEAFTQGLDVALQPCELEDAVYVTYSSPCSAELARSLPYMLAYPEALHTEVAKEYAARWPECELPSIDEVKAFCLTVLREAKEANL